MILASKPDSILPSRWRILLAAPTSAAVSLPKFVAELTSWPSRSSSLRRGEGCRSFPRWFLPLAWEVGLRRDKSCRRFESDAKIEAPATADASPARLSTWTNFPRFVWRSGGVVLIIVSYGSCWKIYTDGIKDIHKEEWMHETKLERQVHKW